jgi:asparagine synthase (glutamine-hydrolysing)
MCGIVGKISADSKVLPEDIKVLCDKIVSRGPDAHGVFTYNNIGFGHRRLSVIDVVSGNQPMQSIDENVSIVFNGEIYNFKVLRNELEYLGCTFITNSDTEVIIQYYIQFGIEITLQNLEGMFAFALYDKKLNKTYIARDKFGEKPLYYCQTNDSLFFASELKAIENLSNKQIDLHGLNLFLSLSYIPAPFTIYKNICKLMPGTYIEVDEKCRLKFTRYYDLLEKIKTKPVIDDFDKAKIELEKLLIQSVGERTVSDVPIGSFLSGGIDSSIISAIMARNSKYPVSTFSIGFSENEYDESERAKLVAKHIGSEHYVKYLDYADVVNGIDEIILYYDEPFGDSSCIPSNYLARLAREKITVALTGDCADELFGGYEKYLASYYINMFHKLPESVKFYLKLFVSNIPHNRITNRFLRRIKKVLDNSSLTNFDLHYTMMCLGVKDSERSELLTNMYYVDVKSWVAERYFNFSGGTEMEKGFYTDMTTVLEGDMLVKVDRICMKNSLEARVPFLDSKIVEFAYRIPEHFKIKGRNKKFILKETFKRYLPQKTFSYKKQGFGVPVDYWLKNQLKKEFSELIELNFIRDQGIFNPVILNRWFQEHLEGKQNHKGKLWNVYVFQKWYMSKMV